MPYQWIVDCVFVRSLRLPYIRSRITYLDYAEIVEHVLAGGVQIVYEP